MGQCWVKCSASGDFEVASVTASYAEGTAFRLRHTDGPLSAEEQAVDELLGPLFQLALEARFGQQLCLHVFTVLTRVARLCLSDPTDGPSMAVRLDRLREVAWGVEELLDGFCSRGWLLRLLCTTRLDALVKWRLDDLAALATDLERHARDRGPAANGNSNSAGGASLAPSDDFVVEVDGARQLAAGLRNARRLQEALARNLPSVMAPHGGAGDPSAMDTFMKRITPLVKGGDEPLRQLEIQEEVQIAVASLSVGPHRALRHPDLQYFWWRHMAGLEEVPWSTLWPHLATFLGNTPRLSDGAGDTGAALALLRSPDMVRLLQAAVHRMGYANYVNAAELDMAFGSGNGNGECTTLDEQLKILLAPGRPILLARTSKGARAEGWVKEAAARKAAAAGAPMVRVVSAPGLSEGGIVTRQASAADFAGALDEEDMWYDAGSNFSRSSSSAYMSVLAGGDDSGIWPGRANLSRPVSQVLLVAGNEDSPRPQPSRVPSALQAADAGLWGEMRISRRSSAQARRSKTASLAGMSREGMAEDPDLVAVGEAARPVSVPVPAAAADTAPAAAARTAGGTAGGSICPEIEPAEEIVPCGPPESNIRPQLVDDPIPQQNQHSQQQKLEIAQQQDPPLQQQPNPSSHLGRPGGAAAATHWPAAPGLARLVGRDDDLSCFVQAVLACRGGSPAAAGGSKAASTGGIVAAPVPLRSRYISAGGPPAACPAGLLVSGPAGCGRTALVAAAADRLVATGAWTCAAFADVRCAAGPEEAALEMALALNVPFYAADRPAGVRLLSWLRTYGPQLRQGLVLDNVDLLLGLGKDEALEVAQASAAASQTAPGSSSAPSASSTLPVAGGPSHSGQPLQQVPQMKRAPDPDASPLDPEDRRRRVLRLLRDMVAAAPGLQLVLVSRPGVTSELLRPCMPQDLSIRFYPVGLISQEAARQLLRNALGTRGDGGGCGDGSSGGDAPAPLETQIDTVVQASNCLPGLLRLAARAVRCDVQDMTTIATWASDALRRAEGGSAAKPPDYATSLFAGQLVSNSLLHLPADARAVLCCLVTLGCPLEEEDVTAAAAFLGHPGIVRAGLCCLYDRGLLTFQDLNQRHDVVGHVRTWMLQCCGFMLGPAVHSTSMAGAPAPAAKGGRTPSRLGTSGGSAGAGVGATGATAGAAAPSGAGEEPPPAAGGGAALAGEAPGAAAAARRARSAGGAGQSRRGTAAGRCTSAGGRTDGSSNTGRNGGAPAGEKGIRLSILVQHLDGVLSQVGELYDNGCRVAALRVYNNSRALTDRVLLLVPAWLSKTSPSSPTAADFAAVMSRHLNKICRHVLLPGQLARASQDLADLVPWLPSAHDRLTAYVTAARAHIHLMALKPASQHLATADELTRQLYPSLAALVEANKPSAQPRAKTTGGVGGDTGNGSGAAGGGRIQEGGGGKPSARVVSASAGGGSVAVQGSLQAKEKLDLSGIPPQVAQLVLAHAEMAAALRQYGTASRHMESFLELLAAAGMAQSLEGAQARMQLGDLCLRRNRPPAEAVAQYEIAATLLMQLYGQSHFRVGRAMLAAARCSPENQPPNVPVALPETGGGGGGSGGSGGRRRRGSRRSPLKAHRPLEAQLRDCLYVQQLSQGKFNLDVAEVEVARGTLLCRQNQPDEALSCGLVALGIVLDILGDGTPQVAECLALVALALRQKSKPLAASAIMQHAQAVRMHAAAAIAAACDAGTTAAIARPRPTKEVVLENLIDLGTSASKAHLLPAPAAGTVAVAGAAEVTAAAVVAGKDDGEARAASPTVRGLSPRSLGITPKVPLRGGTLLQRSPIVQVPLPDDTSESTRKATPRKSGSLPPLLTPSPLLIVLDPGDDCANGGSGVHGEAGSEAQPLDTPQTPDSPMVVENLAARIAAAEAAPGRLVHHVSYPPPLAPVDSVPVGFDETVPSPGTLASDAEWPPRSAAATPSSAGVGAGVLTSPSASSTVGATPTGRGGRVDAALMSPSDSSVAGVSPRTDGGSAVTAVASPIASAGASISPGAWAQSVGASSAPTSPFAASQVAPAASAAAAMTATAAALAASPERQVAEDVDYELQGGQPDGRSEATDGTPGSQKTLVSSSATRMVSSAPRGVPSEVSADTPQEDMADPTGVLLEDVTQGTTPDVATLSAPSTPAQSTPQTADDKDYDDLASGRKVATPDGMGMHLPFPPPPAAAATAAATAASAAVSSSSGGGASSYLGGGPVASDPWCTPIRTRRSGPLEPHLHPSPLTLAAPRYCSSVTETSGNMSDNSPQPFSPGLSLPQPPLLATAGTSAELASSHDASAAAAAAVAAAAAAAAAVPVLSTTAPASENNSTHGSETPLAQLSWSAYSPTADRVEQDSRAYRGGIVFPTPSSTPGPTKMAQRAPWLSWATSGGAAESSPDTPLRRELRFPDVDAEGVPASAALVGGAASAAGSAVDAARPAGLAVATEPAPRSWKSSTSDGEFVGADWAAAAAGATVATATLSPGASQGTPPRADVGQEQQEQQQQQPQQIQGHGNAMGAGEQAEVELAEAAAVLCGTPSTAQSAAGESSTSPELQTVVTLGATVAEALTTTTLGRYPEYAARTTDVAEAASPATVEAGPEVEFAALNSGRAAAPVTAAATLGPGLHNTTEQVPDGSLGTAVIVAPQSEAAAAAAVEGLVAATVELESGMDDDPQSEEPTEAPAPAAALAAEAASQQACSPTKSPASSEESFSPRSPPSASRGAVLFASPDEGISAQVPTATALAADTTVNTVASASLSANVRSSSDLGQDVHGSAFEEEVRTASPALGNGKAAVEGSGSGAALSPQGAAAAAAAIAIASAASSPSHGSAVPQAYQESANSPKPSSTLHAGALLERSSENGAGMTDEWATSAKPPSKAALESTSAVVVCSTSASPPAEDSVLTEAMSSCAPYTDAAASLPATQELPVVHAPRSSRSAEAVSAMGEILAISSGADVRAGLADDPRVGTRVARVSSVQAEAAGSAVLGGPAEHVADTVASSAITSATDVAPAAGAAAASVPPQAQRSEDSLECLDAMASRPERAAEQVHAADAAAMAVVLQEPEAALEDPRMIPVGTEGPAGGAALHSGEEPGLFSYFAAAAGSAAGAAAAAAAASSLVDSSSSPTDQANAGLTAAVAATAAGVDARAASVDAGAGAAAGTTGEPAGDDGRDLPPATAELPFLGLTLPSLSSAFSDASMVAALGALAGKGSVVAEQPSMPRGSLCSLPTQASGCESVRLSGTLDEQYAAAAVAAVQSLPADDAASATATACELTATGLAPGACATPATGLSDGGSPSPSAGASAGVSTDASQHTTPMTEEGRALLEGDSVAVLGAFGSVIGEVVYPMTEVGSAGEVPARGLPSRQAGATESATASALPAAIAAAAAIALAKAAPTAASTKDDAVEQGTAAAPEACPSLEATAAAAAMPAIAPARPAAIAASVHGHPHDTRADLGSASGSAHSPAQRWNVAGGLLDSNDIAVSAGSPQATSPRTLPGPSTGLTGTAAAATAAATATTGLHPLPGASSPSPGTAAASADVPPMAEAEAAPPVPPPGVAAEPPHAANHAQNGLGELQRSALSSSSSAWAPAGDSDPVTPAARSRASSTSGDGCSSVGGDAALITPTGRRLSGTSAARIPLPPSHTGSNSQRVNRSGSRIPTPPLPASSGPVAAAATATTAPTPSPPPSQQPFRSRLPRPPTPSSAPPQAVGVEANGDAAGGAADAGSAKASHTNDPAAAASWTLYSSPAYLVPDAANSPPRGDGDAPTPEAHDGAVSSPAARYAGSYTAAYLMRAKAKSAIISSSWGLGAETAGVSEVGGVGAGLGGGAGAAGASVRSPVDVGFLSAGVTAAGTPANPRVPHGIKVHNPLFVSHNPRSLGGDVTSSSYGFEHEEDEAGLGVHSEEFVRSSSMGGVRAGSSGGGRNGNGGRSGGYGGRSTHGGAVGNGNGAAAVGQNLNLPLNGDSAAPFRRARAATYSGIHSRVFVSGSGVRVAVPVGSGSSGGGGGGSSGGGRIGGGPQQHLGQSLLLPPKRGIPRPPSDDRGGAGALPSGSSSNGGRGSTSSSRSSSAGRGSIGGGRGSSGSGRGSSGSGRRV